MINLRLAIAFALLSMCTGCEKSQVTMVGVGSGETESHMNKENESLSAQLRFEYAEPDQAPRNLGFRLHFRLKNTGTASIYYSGYSETYLRKQFQRLGPKGWVKEIGDWCGTGSKEYEIAAGHELEFNMGWSVDKDDRPFRVGIGCMSKNTNTEPDWIIAWSQQINITK